MRPTERRLGVFHVRENFLYLISFAQVAAQNGIDETGLGAVAGVLGLLNGFVDGGVRRNAVEPENLVEAQAQKILERRALLAPALLGAQPGETVWDMCAAPGGKTTFIAQQMNNTGKIIASDIEPNRLKLVRENGARLGVSCVEAVVSSTINSQTETQFDRILIDAPCSNTGVVRRRVDLRWRISPEEILRLQKTQLELLQQAAIKLKPTGILVYSTCSLEPEENSEVVKQFLADNAEFTLKTERQLLPFTDGVDGAFVAKFQRK